MLELRKQNDRESKATLQKDSKQQLKTKSKTKTRSNGLTDNGAAAGSGVSHTQVNSNSSTQLSTTSAHLSSERQSHAGDTLSAAPPARQSEISALQRCVDSELAKYFAMLEGHAPRGLYRMVMSQAECALIRHVLEVCNDNQSRAAAYLGISRGKLRSRIKELSLD